MAEIVNVHAAKTHLSSLLERVARGEEIIIARAGKPIARLVPVGVAERPLGFVAAHLDDAFFEPLPDEELAAWGELPVNDRFDS
jgi:prevent-host-death family protein